MGKTHKNTWKQRERSIAAAFGAKRTPLSGGNSGITRSDSTHPRLFIEAKLRAKVALVTLWDKVKAMAKREKKIPLVVVCVKGRPGAWALVRLEDLKSVAIEYQEVEGDV